MLAVASTRPTSTKQASLPPLLQAIQWEKLFSLAERHGVLPLLCQGLRGVEHLVPAPHMQTLEGAYRTNLHKALLLSRELIRITEHLTKLGIEAMPYKGLALAEALYGDIALRQAGDIDLLIQPRDLQRVKDAVAQLGYTTPTHFSGMQADAYLKSGYEYAFDSQAGRNVLEVQWALQPRFYAVDFDLKGIFERSIRLIVAGQPMKTPGYEDLFLTLSVHAAKHVWGRLVWLCDIARLTSRPDLDWNWIGTQARRLGIRRSLQVSLLLANHLLQAEIPTEAQAVFSADTAATALACEIQTHVAAEHAFNVESVEYFRLMLRLRERPADRIKFVSRLLLTPGPGEWQAIQLPRSLFPLYRLVRVSRLCSRLVTG